MLKMYREMYLFYKIIRFLEIYALFLQAVTGIFACKTASGVEVVGKSSLITHYILLIVYN